MLVVVTGKPGAGKSRVVHALALKLRLKEICYESKILAVLDNSYHARHVEISQMLGSGGAVPEETVSKLIIDELTAEIAANRGIVVECPADCQAVLFHIIGVLSLNDRYVQQQCLIVELVVEDDDIISKRSRQWIDPVTGSLYPHDLVDLSIEKYRARLNGVLNADNEGENAQGTEEDEEVKDAEQSEGGSSEKLENDDHENNDGDDKLSDADENDHEEPAEKDSETGPEDDMAAKLKLHRSNLPQIKLLPMAIVDRLVHRTEDAIHVATQQTADFQKIRTADQLRRLASGPHYFSVSALQPTETIVDAIAHSLKLNCLNIGPPRPKHIKVEGAGPLIEQVKRVINEPLHPSIPRLKISLWGTFCPVTYYESNVFTEGGADFATSYMQYVYLLASEKHLRQFEQNPKMYINNRPKLHKLKICISASPVTDTTLLAKNLSRQFGPIYVSTKEILSKINWNSSEEAIVKIVAKKLRNGTVIPSDMLIDLMKSTLHEIEKRGHGWIIDDFPQSGDQVTKLMDAGFLPDYFILVKNDTETIVVDTTNAQSTSQDAMTDTLVINSAKDDNVAEPLFPERLNAFKEEIVEVVKNFEDNNVPVLQIPVAPTLRATYRLIQVAVDSFTPKAMIVQKSPEYEAYVDFGTAKDYCPVTLKQNKMLRQGSSRFACEYKALEYYCSSDEARTAFMKDAEHYINISPADIPPPRFCIIGPAGAGKSTISAHILECGLKKIEFIRHIREVRQQYTNIFGDVDLEQPLSAEHTHAFLEPLFTQQPYVSKGFVIEGYPRSIIELSTMLKTGYFVDAILGIKVDPSIVMKRLLPIHLAENPNLLEMEQEGGEEEENPLQTLKDDINIAYFDDYLYLTEKEASLLDDIGAAAENMDGCPFYIVESNRSPRAVWFNVHKLIENLLFHREDILQKTTAVTRRTAKTVLDNGFKTLSAFGMHCPVASQEQGRISIQTFGNKPIIVGSTVYWALDRPHKELFCKSPLRYMSSTAPTPCVKPKVLVLGAPYAGKSLATTKVAAQFGLASLQMNTILQDLIGITNIHLCRRIKHQLLNGYELPQQEISQAMALACKRGEALDRGWVLDGYPDEVSQAESLEEYDVRPDVVFILDCPLTIRQRRLGIERQVDSESIMFPTSNMLDRNSVDTEKTLDELANYYQSVCGNVFRIDATQSRWMTWASISNSLDIVIKAMQTYYCRLMQEKAASVHHVGLLWRHIDTNWAHFKRYCPVALKADRLIDCTAIELIAEYKGRYYQMSNSDTLQRFLECPEDYIHQNMPPTLPTAITAQAVRASFPRQIEFLGYCPVTLMEGDGVKESIVEGSIDHTVEYASKLYSLQNDDCMHRFMQCPWRYTEYIPPNKLPPKTPPISLPALPIPGYLEHTLSKVLNTALARVGRIRPKLPFRSASATALYYIALYLKANNPKMRDFVRRNYDQRLIRVIEDCGLASVLSKAMEQQGGSYIAATELEPEFANQMQRFQELRSKAD